MTGTLNRIIALALLPVAVLTITACQRTAEEPFAKVVPSAIIEVRDEPTQAGLDKETQVVMLGTGNPVPDAHRAGPSIAVIHKGEAYLFDIGAGAIRNAIIARYQYDIPSLYPSQICCVFLTHLHSDHTMDYAELAYTLWWRRRKPLFAWGPRGLEQMTQGMVEMMAADTASPYSIFGKERSQVSLSSNVPSPEPFFASQSGQDTRAVPGRSKISTANPARVAKLVITELGGSPIVLGNEGSPSTVTGRFLSCKDASSRPRNSFRSIS